MSAAATASSPAARIGPGRLILVVGPSGAGKDTVIRIAREALAGDEHYVFPRRMITRPASPAEDSIEITREVFDSLRQSGDFAVSWTAHGLGYGLPTAIDDEIAKGRTVICNASRTVIGDLRARYANPWVIEITAPRALLEQRLATRGRDEDGDVALRIGRSTGVQAPADVTIMNDADPETAGRAFLDELC